MANKCPTCQTAMKPLFTHEYCPFAVSPALVCTTESFMKRKTEEFEKVLERLSKVTWRLF